MTRIATVLALIAALLAAAIAAADTVTEWDSIWLDCIRATGGPPCPIARAGAMMSAAVYDAVNSIDRTHEPYLGLLSVSPVASREAAAAVAAHDVLAYLYPGRQAILDAALAASLAGVPNGAAKTAGIDLGQRAAHAVILSRMGDGSDDATPYPVGASPGEWRPTPPDFGNPASPNWGRVKPWVMLRGDQFRPAGPLGFGMGAGAMRAILRSPKYAKILDDVKAFGARASTRRSAYQTQTAYFWANDVNGTYKPPGHLNVIAQALASQNHHTLSENARFFALLNLALGDAGICAWDCKYETTVDFWRPITGIRMADVDGNKHTVADPAWEPLNAFTPPFPAYVSGHATFGATAAAIFRRWYGTDKMTYTFGTDEPLYTGGPRTYRRFSEAALENGRSRIYLGVHWQFDAEDGYACGTALGNFVFDQILQPIRGHDHGDEDGDPVPVATSGVSVPRIRAPAIVEMGRAGGGITIELGPGDAGPVRVVVLDVQGRQFATLANGSMAAGRHTLTWDGRDAAGERVAPGVYFVRLTTALHSEAARIAVLR